MGNEVLLPTWHDPESFDAWLKTEVAKALKLALSDIQSWHGLHAWLSKRDITLTDTGGSGMRLHAISPKTGEVLDLAVSKGLRMLKRCELEKRWGKFVNAIPTSCIVPDLSHLTPRQVANGVEDFLAFAPDGGIPPAHILRAQQRPKRDATESGNDLHELPTGSSESGAQNGAPPFSDGIRGDSKNVHAAHDHNMRGPGATDAGRSGERSFAPDDSRRAERKAQRSVARADLRQRFSQYKRGVRSGDTEHFKRMSELRAERSRVQKQIREQRKSALAEIPKKTALPVRLITVFEIDGECVRRKLQAEAIFQEKSRALRAVRFLPLSWRAWLFEQSNLGDQAALAALRGIVYQARRDAKGEKLIDIGDVLAVAGTEEYREHQYRAVLARLLEEEKKEAAIRSANSNAVRPYEVDAILARYTGIQWRVTGNGNVEYNLKSGGHLFTDRGNRVTFDRVWVSDDEIRLALLHAKLKFGNQITLTGDDPLFTARMARLADDMRMSILNPELLPIPTRNTVIAPSNQSADLDVSVPRAPPLELSTALKSKKAKIKRSVRPPVLEIPADDLHLAEIVDKMTLPLTAVEWIEQQEKPPARPYTHGDPKVEYFVVYVARDGIAVDHGVAVALYPAPTGLTLHAGDKVIVGGNAELRLPHVPELGEPGQGGTGKGR